MQLYIAYQNNRRKIMKKEHDSVKDELSLIECLARALKVEEKEAAYVFQVEDKIMREMMKERDANP